MPTTTTLTHEPRCPKNLIGESALGPCLCGINRSTEPAPPRPTPRTGRGHTQPGRWKTMTELKAALADHGRAWSDVYAWAKPQRRPGGAPRWSVSDLKAANRVAIEEYLAAGCPTAADVPSPARPAAPPVAKATTASILADHGLSWETVREWGRQTGMPGDHTKPGRPSGRCVRAYLDAHPELAAVAS